MPVIAFIGVTRIKHAVFPSPYYLSRLSYQYCLRFLFSILMYGDLVLLMFEYSGLQPSRMRIPPHGDNPQWMDVLLVDFNQADRGIIDKEGACPASVQPDVISDEQLNNVGMRYKSRVGSNFLLRTPAFNCFHRSLLYLGKCFDSLWSYCGILCIGFPG